ncbi:MAG: PilZ domain-containing protein [Planctomycetes bacterium]|nr:PilZ domain-containing protein [Planctomycetota bacterium]
MVQYKPVHFLGLFGKTSKKHLILDISRDGMQFVTREGFKKEALLSLDISAPDLDNGIIHAQGRVAWVRKAPDLEAYGVGVKFDPMEQTEQDKLKSLIDTNNLNKTKISDSVHLKINGKL